MNKNNQQLLSGLALLLGLGWSLPSQATITSTYDPTAYNTAVSGIGGTAAQVVDFEDGSIPVDTALPSGYNTGGVTFTPSLQAGYSLAVDGSIGGVSGTKVLGAIDGSGIYGKFALGEAITFTFDAPTHAFGIYVVVGSGFDFYPDDATIGFAGTQLTNPLGVVGTSFATGDYLFLGIVDDSATYSSATIHFGPVGTAPGGGGYFELDDVNFTVASGPAPGPGPGPNPGVPEPPMLLLFGLGAVALRRQLNRKA